MPTGYTAGVQDGSITDFRTFAMRCAHAFGALVEMRDAPSDAPIPVEFEMSTYYAKALEGATVEANRLADMTLADAEREAEAEYQRWLGSWRSESERRETEKARYEAMLARVAEWSAPSAEHEQLKQFMADQLSDSIRFDCGYELPAPTRKDAATWLADARTLAARVVERYAEQNEAEIARTNERNEWLRLLRESLEPAGAAAE